MNLSSIDRAKHKRLLSDKSSVGLQSKHASTVTRTRSRLWCVFHGAFAVILDVTSRSQAKPRRWGVLSIEINSTFLSRVTWITRIGLCQISTVKSYIGTTRASCFIKITIKRHSCLAELSISDIIIFCWIEVVVFWKPPEDCPNILLVHGHARSNIRSDCCSVLVPAIGLLIALDVLSTLLTRKKRWNTRTIKWPAHCVFPIHLAKRASSAIRMVKTWITNRGSYTSCLIAKFADALIVPHTETTWKLVLTSRVSLHARCFGLFVH